MDGLIPLSPGETFVFACSSKVGCYNQCCRDLNQFLTPYDILRLKNRLALSSGEFLERYTQAHIGPESGLPVITLTPEAQRCPFVRPTGCSVYEDRPSSCRIYPLVRLMSRSRETGARSERHLLIREAHCQGFQQGPAWTAAAWQTAQGLDAYNAMNDLMLDIIRLNSRRSGGNLDSKSKQLFYLSLYDLDGFKASLSAGGPPDTLAADAATLDLTRKDDAALLRFGFDWLRRTVFKDAPRKE